MVNYYSQQGEDRLLVEFFNHKRTGFFVDVGAYDGVYLSNSYTFEKMGWTGVCVEACREYYELCVANRPRSKCYHAVCLDRECAQVKFRAERGGLFSGVNTDEAHANFCYRENHIHFDGFRTVELPATTLDMLLSGYGGEIDLVSIDVEGAELAVLKGFNLDRFKPRVLLIEANTFAHRIQLDTYLSDHGYRLARSKVVNHFYVRSEEDARTLRAITFTIKLEQPPHPLGDTYGRSRISFKSDSLLAR